MAAAFKKEFHIYRLSAIDQSVSREYITIALPFHCDHGHVDKAVNGFVPAIKRAITLVPQLAGNLRPASGIITMERGLLEIAVSREMIENFEVHVKHLTDKDSFTYDELLEKHFPSNKLDIGQLAALPTKPDPTSAKAFAVQLNVIRGGIIAVFQQHHSVADLRGICQVIRIASRVGAQRDWDNDTLSKHAVGASVGRQLLSSSSNTTAPPDSYAAPHPSNFTMDGGHSKSATCVLGFSSMLLEGTKEMINSYGTKVKIDPDGWVNPRGEKIRQTVDEFHTLAAILWHGITHARYSASRVNLAPTIDYPGAVSKITLSTSIRERVEPPLPSSYFGNAIIDAEGRERVEKLSVPLEPGWMQWAAQHVLIAQNDVSDRAVRVAIAKANQRSYTTNDAPNTSASRPADLMVSEMSDLLPPDANLSLGLGQPSTVRELIDADAEDGCIIHARPQEGQGIWEVTVTLRAAVIERLLEDESFMKFVLYADGERYVNGVTENQEIGNRINVEDQADRAKMNTAWRARQVTVGVDAMAGLPWMGFEGFPGWGGPGGDGAGGFGGSGGVGAGPSNQPR